MPGQVDQNEAKVLHSIFSRGESTRTSIALRTRLSLAKVSSILGHLEKEGYVQKIGSATTHRGRPSYLFQIRPGLGYALGVAVGLDRFQIVAMNGAKEVSFRREFPLTLSPDASTHPHSIIDQLSAKISKVIEQDLASSPPILTLGLALPGLVNTRTGTWLLGLWLPGIAHIPAVTLLRKRLGLPVLIEDIARSVAVYEMHRGHGRVLRSFVLIYLGSGVGSGIVLDRQIFRGLHGLAGEIGHIEHAGNTYRCSCSNVGCFETVISATGIQRVFRDRLAEGVVSSLQHKVKDLGLDRILDAARAGDRFTQATLRETGQFLGDACAILIKMYNPEGLIISGEGSRLREFLADPVEQVVRRRVLPEMLGDVKITFAEYNPYQEAHGAALAAMDHHFDWRAHTHASNSQIPPIDAELFGDAPRS